MRRWSVIVMLASAQFVMVLDSTVMNVSIEQVVDDLGTTVTMMQLAITAYTLVMASLMLVGGKIGDLLGRRRTFRIGLALFGLGAGITAVSPNIGVLLLGWSLVEGLGSTLMIPAIAALIAGNYTGRARALCFGISGGVAAAAAAAGPIIGGWVATVWSWRYVFGAEVVIVIVLLIASRVVRDTLPVARRGRLDRLGAVLAVAGLAIGVLAVVQSTQWGWWEPHRSPTIAGHTVEPFGFSVVPFLLLLSAGLLWWFWQHERGLGSRLAHAPAHRSPGRSLVDPLLDVDIVGIARLRAGMSVLFMMNLTLAGLFFAVPLYLQIVLGNDPLDTGIHILPLSIGLFVVALGASRLSARVSPRRIVRFGLLVQLVGVLLLMATLDAELQAWPFLVSMGLVGMGLGALASQLGNVNLSAVRPEQTSEVGGVQGTSQNLGAALGTALVGAVLLTGLTAAFTNTVTHDDAVPSSVSAQVVAESTDGLPFVPQATAAQALRAAGLPSDTVTAITADYADAQLDGLRTAVALVASFVLLTFVMTRHLPAEPMDAAPDEQPVAALA